jgi:quinolinate synthase
VEILAHFYQRSEVKNLAHFVGGSRYLYDRVLKTKARAVLVCGVRFMIEAMERLRPDLEILVPRADAQCPFSQMANASSVESIRREAHSGLRPVVVADIKASAEVRELADLSLVTDTLSDHDFGLRPVYVLPALSAGDPDKTNHIDWPSAQCQVHRQVTAEDALAVKRPHMKLAVNSLCQPQLRAMADFVGDSQAIFDWCAKCPDSQFLIICETGLVESLRQAFPMKEFFESEVEVFCPNMKLVNIKDLLACLTQERLDRLRSQDRLDSLDRLDSRDRLDRLGRLGSLDGLKSLDPVPDDPIQPIQRPNAEVGHDLP